MPSSSKRLLVVAGLGIAVGTLGFVLLRGKAPPRAPSEVRSPETAEIRVPQRSGSRERAIAPAVTTASAAAPTDEAAFMAMLREVGVEDAEGSLELAREGDARFPGSPYAAERGWYAVRALVNLGRIDEAVAESRALVSKHPNSPLALDVARHLLTHPMRDPAEIGYAQGR